MLHPVYCFCSLLDSITDLLLALFFSICSFWCTCQSSSSFLAFSFHSASAALDAESDKAPSTVLREPFFYSYSCVHTLHCIQRGSLEDKRHDSSQQAWLECKLWELKVGESFSPHTVADFHQATAPLRHRGVVSLLT